MPVGGEGGGSADFGILSFSGAPGCFAGADLSEPEPGVDTCCVGWEGVEPPLLLGATGAELNAPPTIPPRITIGNDPRRRLFACSSPIEATFSNATGCGASTMAITEGLTMMNFRSSGGRPPKRSILGCSELLSGAFAATADGEVLPTTMMDGLDGVVISPGVTKDDALAAFEAGKAINMVAKKRRIDSPAARSSCKKLCMRLGVRATLARNLAASD